MWNRLFGVVTIVVLLIGGVAAQQKPQEIELQAAIRTETVVGDLKNAIAQYEQVVRKYVKSDRAVAAQALVRLAECYQKLGDTQARSLFERVVREFPDQKESAALATSRLTVGKMAGDVGIVNRQIWTGPGVDTDGTVSQDGRYLSFTDWDTGDLAIRDLSTGTNRRLTKKGTWSDSSDFAEHSALSRDGSQVAYGWYNRKTDRYELRVGRVDAASGASHRTIFDNPDVIWVAPYDWSPDGKWLAVQLSRTDRTTQLGTLSVVNGAFKAIKSVDWRCTTRLAISPDGSWLAYDLADETGMARDVYVVSADGAREVKVAPHQADEIVMGWAQDGSSLLFASDRSGSMALWSATISNGQPVGAARMVKGDIGNVITGLGTTRAGSLLYGVRTRAVTLGMALVDLNAGNASTASLPFENYTRAIRSPDFSPDGKHLAFIAEQSRARLSLVIATASGERLRELPLTLLSVQLPRWAPDGSITVQARDFKGRAGFFRVDTRTGDIRPLLVPDDANVRVLQISWLRDGRAYLFRRFAAGKTSLVRREVDSGTERLLAETGQTLAGTSVSPDGKTAAYVVIDRTTGTSMLHLVSADGGPPKEILKLSGQETLGNLTLWTPDGRDLLFIKLEGTKPTFWTLSVAGGTPRKLDLPDPAAPDIRLHPDGRTLVYVTGTNAAEVWTLDKFLPPTGKLRVAETR